MASDVAIPKKQGGYNVLSLFMSKRIRRITQTYMYIQKII